MIRRINDIVAKHIQGNLITYFFVILFFMTGISSGAFMSKALTDFQNKELIVYLKNFFSIVDSKAINNLAILKQSLLNNFQTGIIIWILGVTVIGIPLILLIIGLRGFIIGFTVGFFVKQMGFKGVIFSLVSILPQNILIVPCTVFIGVLGISFSLMLIKNKTRKNTRYSIVNQFFLYSTIIAMIHIIIVVGCLIEAYISPFFIKYISTYM
ncbi:stage II sporulation protein M [Paramaledivibacter caminithermalis]|uniref:Stage II sporulation protein M n=1 Tax=Paramaledivibacter caminithermalis (strain DSM 15212 / CIP 107654 / DViRD3) TaxID=1121301 RepID=A0A1M6JPB1_PARC5|nr:stage II sporulation protein M [Paramaledivibacter caminithermalis]SHJ48492.1 stage II sporulation protein M [Paramaledivibacter caminithermalis DSM 15212]